MKFFKDTVTTQQKNLVLQLYRRYAKVAEADDKGAYEDLETARLSAYSKESRIPPSELQAFQRVWDKNAPSRCLHCNAAIPDGKSYCKLHQAVGIKLFCNRRMGGGEVCGGLIDVVNEVRVCQKCSGGKETAKDAKQPVTEGSLAEYVAKHQKESEAITRFWTKRERTADTQPEWVKRKRL